MQALILKSALSVLLCSKWNRALTIENLEMQALKDAATERQQLEAQLSACKQELSGAQANLKAARGEVEELKKVHMSACQQMSTERQQMSAELEQLKSEHMSDLHAAGAALAASENAAFTASRLKDVKASLHELVLLRRRCEQLRLSSQIHRGLALEAVTIASQNHSHVSVVGVGGGKADRREGHLQGGGDRDGHVSSVVRTRDAMKDAICDVLRSRDETRSRERDTMRDTMKDAQIAWLLKRHKKKKAVQEASVNSAPRVRHLALVLRHDAAILLNEFAALWESLEHERCTNLQEAQILKSSLYSGFIC
jgi:hypothetical protein